MSKPKPTSNETPSKAHHVFPAPEWTSLSASLAASLAHEIRNPLLSIKGAAQLLEQVVEGDDKTLANLIISEAARIEQLVATLDPLTPNPAQVSTVMNIHEVTEYVRMAARSFAPEITIGTQYDPSLPEVRVVREALVQALINLVKNAVESVTSHQSPVVSEDATHAVVPPPIGGRLGGGLACAEADSNTLTFAQVAPPPQPSPYRGGGAPAAPFTPTITISTRYLVGERMQRTGGKKLPIELSVTDNGAGVAPDVVGRLFTPFSSTKENGKGLGLAIVAKIVEEHGGLIAYDAPASGGARFSIYLPVA
ncbi:MAG: hypothetical protein K2X09_04830 [Rickettsiales bacterium]|nr:hypothetical protein [Rickettsiales bacterium]